MRNIKKRKNGRYTTLALLALLCAPLTALAQGGPPEVRYAKDLYLHDPSETCIEESEPGDPYRTRGLQQLESNYKSENVIQQTIRERLKESKEVRVLEFGMGHGRVLLELRKLFPNIELHGINRCPWDREADEVFRETAKYFEIFSEKELETVKLPHAHALDANYGLPQFEDNSIDVIYSQVSFRFVIQKGYLLEEFWRVLKPGGSAYFDVQDFIYVNAAGNSEPYEVFFRRLTRRGYDLRRIGQHHYRMRKNTDKPLKTNLVPLIGMPAVADTQPEA